jgi:hypothetical protein
VESVAGRGFVATSNRSTDAPSRARTVAPREPRLTTAIGATSTSGLHPRPDERHRLARGREHEVGRDPLQRRLRGPATTRQERPDRGEVDAHVPARGMREPRRRDRTRRPAAASAANTPADGAPRIDRTSSTAGPRASADPPPRDRPRTTAPRPAPRPRRSVRSARPRRGIARTCTRSAATRSTSARPAASRPTAHTKIVGTPSRASQRACGRRRPPCRNATRPGTSVPSSRARDGASTTSSIRSPTTTTGLVAVRRRGAGSRGTGAGYAAVTWLRGATPGSPRW